MRNISQLDKTRWCIDLPKEQIDKMVKNIELIILLANQYLL